MRTRVKICCIQSIAEARLAVAGQVVHLHGALRLPLQLGEEPLVDGAALRPALDIRWACEPGRDGGGGGYHQHREQCQGERDGESWEHMLEASMHRPRSPRFIGE